MDLKRKLIGALFAVIAGSGLLIACGPESGASCEFDTECADGELCYNKTFCAPECTANGNECIDDEVCTPRTDASGSVCIVPGGTGNNNNNNGKECTTNEQCEEKDPNSFCDVDAGVCKSITVDKEFVTIEVRDVTTAANRCADTTKTEPSPATKLSYVQLSKTDGTILGWGQEVGFDVSKNDNSFNDVTTVLNGEPVGLTGECASEGFTLDNGVALSCGGFVMVQFKDSNGDTVKLADGQQITVGVYGQVCNAAFDKGGEDKYDVYLCDTFSGTNLDNSSCKTKLNTSALNGINSVNVKLPK